MSSFHSDPPNPDCNLTGREGKNRDDDLRLVDRVRRLLLCCSEVITDQPPVHSKWFNGYKKPVTSKQWLNSLPNLQYIFSLDYFGNRRTDTNVSSKFQGVETPSQSRSAKSHLDWNLFENVQWHYCPSKVCCLLWVDEEPWSSFTRGNSIETDTNTNHRWTEHYRTHYVKKTMREISVAWNSK